MSHVRNRQAGGIFYSLKVVESPFLLSLAVQEEGEEWDSELPGGTAGDSQSCPRWPWSDHLESPARARARRRGRPIPRSNKHKYPEIIHGSGDLSDASSAAADQIRAAVNWPPAGGAASGKRVDSSSFFLPSSLLPRRAPAAPAPAAGLAPGWAGIPGVPLAAPRDGARRDLREPAPHRGMRLLPPALCPASLGWAN